MAEILDEKLDDIETQEKELELKESASTSLWRKIFSFSRRLNRLPYVLCSLILFFLSFSATLMWVVKYGDVTPDAAPDDNTILALGIIIIFLYVINLILTVRRLHDLKLSGHWCWLLIAVNFAGGYFEDNEMILKFFGIVSLLCLLILYFKRGTVGINNYGDDPLEN